MSRKPTKDTSATTKPVRCAIYTRKSTEEGLDQDFNTLDAQRDAAESYIRSQKHEGWECLAETYDDGGFSGGNLERPALRRLMADIGQVTITTYRVSDVYYGVHTKRGASEDDPKSMRVDYKVGCHEYKSEWICFEHQGYARQKAVSWWRRRSPDPVPDTADRAVELAQSGALATTTALTMRSVAGEPYERIIDYELGELPEPLPAHADLESARAELCDELQF